MPVDLLFRSQSTSEVRRADATSGARQIPFGMNVTVLRLLTLSASKVEHDLGLVMNFVAAAPSMARIQSLDRLKGGKKALHAVQGCYPSRFIENWRRHGCS